MPEFALLKAEDRHPAPYWPVSALDKLQREGAGDQMGSLTYCCLELEPSLSLGLENLALSPAQKLCCKAGPGPSKQVGWAGCWQGHQCMDFVLLGRSLMYLCVCVCEHTYLGGVHLCAYLPISVR